MTGPAQPRLSEVHPAALRQVLAGTGVQLDLGSATVVVRSAAPSLAEHLSIVYGAFALEPGGEFADIRIELIRPANLRRWIRPQVSLRSDGEIPFDPFPADTALPLMEWGTNWLIGKRLNDLLLFHAGCLERDGLALLLPAMPGSGKSTLTAALAHSGWRLLSDEFGVCDPLTRRMHAMLKPVALKNRSIEVIREFAPDARIGPDFPKTRKGRVAHVAATADAFNRRHQSATPAAVILPRWQPSGPTVIEPLDLQTAFAALAFNSFNYELLGEVAFDAVLHLVRHCRAWTLSYSRLDDVVAELGRRWPELSAGATA